MHNVFPAPITFTNTQGSHASPKQAITVQPTVCYPPPYAALQRADLTGRGVCDYGQHLKLQMNPAVV
jgi:hypothetical protein